MKIKSPLIEIDKIQPFKNCKLGRELYAHILTDIVSEYKDGFVMAINNEWGDGKTTFVKMWQQHLANNEFQTIYFNAWENDFDNNPLVALISELHSLTDNENTAIYKNVIKKGAILAKNVIPSLAKGLLKKYIPNLEEISLDAAQNLTKASTEILEEEIKQYSEKKESISDFRHELTAFIQSNSDQKPLIFIIDELDRCRPSYSVEVLEQIKHFFSVSGIVFVLSIDKKHLGAAIRGYYGSPDIDTNEYLRRFIDLEYSIPPPSPEQYNEFLYQYYQLDEFFSLPERLRLEELRHDGSLLLQIADIIFAKHKITLRQQERIFGILRLIMRTFKGNHYSFSYLLIVLVYYRIVRNDVFEKIERKEYSHQQISDLFYDTIDSQAAKSKDVNLMFVEALFLLLYNNYLDFNYKIELFTKVGADKYTTPIQSQLEQSLSRETLGHQIASFRFLNYNSLGLQYLINRIKLTESIK
jgi:hypothetical protein